MEVRRIKTYSRKRKLITYLAESDDDAQDLFAASTLPSPPASSSPVGPASSSPAKSERPSKSPINTPSSSTTTHSSPLSLIAQRPKKRFRTLTQLTIDLGVGSICRKCQVCGMEYVPSNSEDAKTHRGFHNSSVGGIPVPGGLAEKWNVLARCNRRSRKSNQFKATKSVTHTLDTIVEIAQTDAFVVRKYARKVLEFADQELGAVQREHDVWSQPNMPKQKVYLYVQDNKCVGLCLAERIKSASQVEPREPATPLDSSSISTSSETTHCLLGISRIWVSREFRRLGVASKLLDIASQEFTYGVKIAKDRVAFSQPTDSGARLARAWFGVEYGWLVYHCTTQEEHVF